MIQEPVQPTLDETPPARPSGGPRQSRGLIGLVIVACLALAVPVIGAIAASFPAAPASVVGASAAPGASAEPNSVKGNGKGPNWNNGNGNGPKGNKGLKGDRGPGKGPITIRAIAGGQLSLATEDGWTRTITVGPGTTITKGGVAIGVADLRVGDEIRFRQTRNADGTYAITAIVVPTPRAGGEVSAIDGNNITVKGKGGATHVIIVTGSTVYTVGDAAGSKADVKVGTEIDAEGTVAGDTFTATAIHVELPRLGGTVTGKTANTITVTTKAGTPATIHVSSGTTYRIKGNAAAGLADIAVGDRVSAAGTLRADGSLDAVAVGTGNGKGNGNGDGDNDDMDDDTPAPVASAAPG